MRPTDQMLARLGAEAEEKQQFIDGLIEDAEKASRDLTPQELELVERTRTRQQELAEQMEPLREARRIGGESEERMRELAKLFGEKQAVKKEPLEYRSAGAYLMDYWQAQLGREDARERLDLYLRAAAHQTTADNPGLLPEQILGPIIQFVDDSRPAVNAFGPRPLPGGSWSRPRITQHSDVGPQAGEKTELVSRKLIIGKVPVSPETYGGYVNISRQDIDWTQPGILDIVINDLASVYAQETEQAFCTTLDGATTAGPVLPATPTVADIVGAIWTAVGTSYATLKGAGTTIILASPDMLGLLGPAFPPINPQNAQSPGFSAQNFGTGAQPGISGIPVVVSAGLDAGTIIVANTAAAEAYEDRIGPLQVAEPSVLGVQVAYAGYFADLVIEPAGLIEITKTP